MVWRSCRVHRFSTHKKMVFIAVPVHTHKYTTLGTDVECLLSFFWRLIKENKYKGVSTKKSEIVGVFESGGFSSKYSVFQHIWEETLIRVHNNQNILIVIIILILRLTRNSYKQFLK